MKKSLVSNNKKIIIINFFVGFLLLLFMFMYLYALRYLKDNFFFFRYHFLPHPIRTACCLKIVAGEVMGAFVWKW